MKIHSDSHEPEVRIEIVPLIDVIFCILTFFILAAVTLTRQNAINVDLPRAATGTTQMRKLLIVTVDPIGQTYVEKQPVSRDQLYQALLNFRQTSPEGTMVLYASRAASYNDVVQVLDLLQSVGGDRVALATLPSSTSADLGLPGSNSLPGYNSLPGSNGLLTPGGSSIPNSLPGSSLPESTAPYNLNQPLPGSDLPGSNLPSQPSTGASAGSSKERSLSKP
jgi:biopolymer transport protein ExbD